MAWILASIIVAMVVLYPLVAYFFYGLGGRDEARRQLREESRGRDHQCDQYWPHARPGRWQP